MTRRNAFMYTPSQTRRKRTTGTTTTPRSLSVPERHQLRIARDTLNMPDAMVGVLGGPDKAESRAIIRRLTGKHPTELHKHYGHPLESAGHEHPVEGAHEHTSLGLGRNTETLT